MIGTKINEILDNKQVSEVTELNLEAIEATNFDGLTSDYTDLETLKLANNKFNNLKGFPKLNALKTLDLSKNSISGGLDALVDACAETLVSLNLSGNSLATIESLAPLQKCSLLTSLDLSGNDVCQVENYKVDLVALLPHLKSLDGEDIITPAGDTNGHSESGVNGVATKRSMANDDEEEPAEKAAKVDESNGNEDALSATNDDNEKSEGATDETPHAGNGVSAEQDSTA